MGDSNAEVGEATIEDANNTSSQKSHHWLASSFINVYELGERAAFYTIKASMPMHLYLYLGLSRTSTVVIYHIFESIASFSCLLGAIFADGHIGKFRTIFFASMLYFSGLSCLIISAIPDTSKKIFTFIGLTLCAVACGGVRPAVAAFGGDQFPESSYQKKLLIFFAIYVAVSHSGMFVGQILTPILRKYSFCYATECYIMPFVAGLLLLVGAIVSLLFGQNKYNINPVKTHVVIMVLMAIALGIVRKIKALRKKIAAEAHWLDHAVPECGTKIVEDTKILMKQVLLTLPAPLFFIIYCQTGSNWVFQAAAMNRTLGSVERSAESIVMVYPLLAIVFIPIYFFAIKPLLHIFKLKSLVQKITIGGLLATISVALAAAVELHLEETEMPPQRSGVCQFRIYNGVPFCKFNLTTNIPGARDIFLKSMGFFENLQVNVKSKTQFTYNLTSNNKHCHNMYNEKFNLKERTAISYFFTWNNSKVEVKSFTEIMRKPWTGALVRILNTDLDSYEKMTVRGYDNGDVVYFRGHPSSIKPVQVPSTTIDIFLKDRLLLRTEVTTGEVLTILAAKSHHHLLRKRIHLADPNSMSVLWLIPQFVFLAMSDVIITISVLHFAYVTAPASMKTLFIACWYMTILLGNLLLIIVIKSRMFPWKTYEYTFYAVLMFIGTVIFAILAFLYEKPVKKDVED